MNSLLDRISDFRKRTRNIVELVESGPPVPLSQTSTEIFAHTDKNRLAELDLNLTYEPYGDSYRIRLKAGHRIGTARYGSGRKTVDVVVQPKIGLLDLFRILRAGNQYVQMGDSESTSYLNKGEPLPLLLEYILEEIYQFLLRTPTKSFRLAADDAARRPKGKFRVERYLQHNIPRGLYERMPCQYVELDMDSIENRIIRFTVRLVQRLSSMCPSENRNRLDRKSVACLQLLAGISDAWFTTVQVGDRLREIRNLQMKRIIDLCRMLISGATISLNPGQTLEFFSFRLDMAAVFERYIRKAFYEAGSSVGYVGETLLEHSMDGIAKRIRLDGHMRGEEGCIVECKYKLVQDTAELNFDEGEMRNADIFQSVAYSCFSRTRAKRAFLVYPMIGAGGSPIQISTKIGGFCNSLGEIDLTVVLVSLNSPVSAVVDSIRELLRGKRG